MESETAIVRGREDEPGALRAPLKDLGVDTFNTKGKNIGAIGNAGHFEARMGLKRRDDFLGCSDGLGVALRKAFEVMKRDGSERPHLAEPVAEHTA